MQVEIIQPNALKETVKAYLEADWHYSGSFGRDQAQVVWVYIILVQRHQSEIKLLKTTSEKGLVSLQEIVPIARLFEREISDLFGVEIVKDLEPVKNEGMTLDTRHLVKHECWEEQVYPLLKSYDGSRKIQIKNEVEPYAFKGIEGTGGLQIPVGPVHAGIIEPGHFRFSIGGEPIENLEIRLQYKHRGIEKKAESMDANTLNLLFERVAGESTVAYGEAYALLVEKLTPLKPSTEVKCLRTLFLELERIYNYLDDLGGICVDIGYSYPAKRYQLFSEEIHQCCEHLTGSRFMRHVIVPGGIRIDWDGEKTAYLRTFIEKINAQIEEVYQLTLETVSFLDRVEHTGMVTMKEAKLTHMTGVVGRASGIHYDVRATFPYEGYETFKMEPLTKTIGGVFERYQLKHDEIQRGIQCLLTCLEEAPTHYEASKPAIILAENMETVVAVETVKGELLVYGATGSNNKFDRVYFKTPSFTSWEGLTLAVLDEIVPDFPLCNKSFNMSYSENDR